MNKGVICIKKGGGKNMDRHEKNTQSSSLVSTNSITLKIKRLTSCKSDSSL